MNTVRSTSKLIKSLLVSWLTLILLPTLWFSVTKSTFCPVTSPNDETVYIADTPSKLIIGLTKTGCAMECYAKYRDCRCFNYNVTSLNCSLFNFEPISYGVDKGNSTKAYEALGILERGVTVKVTQVIENPLKELELCGIDYL